MGKFLWGAVIGGVAALLFTPKSGKEMRKAMASRYKETAKKGDKILNKISNSSEDLFEQAKDLAFDTKRAAGLILNEIQKEEKKTKNRKRRKRS